jgi:predicted GNAT family acetyltransferase
MATDRKIDVVHDREDRRFYAEVGDFQGYLKYRERGATMVEYHDTFVPVEIRKEGIAGELAKAALEYAKNNALQVIPTCSYVDDYMRKNPEYEQLRVKNMDNVEGMD